MKKNPNAVQIVKKPAAPRLKTGLKSGATIERGQK